MNTSYSSLPANVLVTRVRELVREERRITAQLLHHLREVEHRRLYAELGYASLFEFCQKDLGYSESAAYRRISAMRLLRDLPEVEQKLKTGALTLSHACSLQTFLQAEKKQKGRTYRTEEKQELLQKLEGKSHREAERVLAEISPQNLPQERKRALDNQHTEIRLVADAALCEKLDRARELLSHRGVESYAELLEVLADEFLKRADPLRKKSRSVSPAPEVEPAQKVAASGSFGRQHIPAQVRRQIWIRDQGRCCYRSPQTGRACGSRWKLAYCSP